MAAPKTTLTGTFPNGTEFEIETRRKQIPTHAIVREIDGERFKISVTRSPESALVRERRDRPVGWTDSEGKLWGAAKVVTLGRVLGAPPADAPMIDG